MSQDILQRVRKHRAIIRDDTREALAAAFGGEQLYEWIYPFSRTESVEKLNWRRFQTAKHYRNYVKEIGRKYLEGLYRGHSITRKYGDADFDKYLVDIYDPWFRRDVAMPALYLPELYVVCSLPDTPVKPITKQDEQDMGLHPYPVVVYPQHVRDYEIDEYGNVLWISFDVGDEVHCYDDESFWIATSQSGEDSVSYFAGEKKPHGFPRCPVIRIAYEENPAYAEANESPVGHAFMKDVVSLSIADLQYRSMLVEATYAHLFYKIVMGEETARTTVTEGIGNSSVIVENPEERGTTRYMPTPSFEIQALKEIVYQTNPAQIYQTARLRDYSAVIAQSGLAKTFDMVPETGVLSAIAMYLSDADARITDMLASAWLGENFDFSTAHVTYPSSFDVRSPLETMGQFAQYVGMATASPLPTSRTAIREMVKDVQRSMLPAASAELLQKIDQETDVAEFAPTTDIGIGAQGDQLPFQQFTPQDAGTQDTPQAEAPPSGPVE